MSKSAQIRPSENLNSNTLRKRTSKRTISKLVYSPPEKSDADNAILDQKNESYKESRGLSPELETIQRQIETINSLKDWTSIVITLDN